MWHGNVVSPMCQENVMEFKFSDGIIVLLSAGPFHPANLLNQNQVNVTQCYSQMSGTNKP